MDSHARPTSREHTYLMRLFVVKAVCRKCDHTHVTWVSESQRKAAFTKPHNEVLGLQVCGVRSCGDDVPILARYVRESEYDHKRTRSVLENPRLRNLRLSEQVAPSIPALTERQAKVCTLILEGMTDRAIARALFVAKPTVRKEVRQIANVLCADEPIACRMFPRQTIVAYHASRSGLLESGTPFGFPA